MDGFFTSVREEAVGVALVCQRKPPDLQGRAGHATYWDALPPIGDLRTDAVHPAHGLQYNSAGPGSGLSA
jgi:hypothetical protein